MTPPSVSGEALESRIREATLGMLSPITLLIGLLYVPVAISHLLMMPGHARVPMFAVAILFAAVLLYTHRWILRNPTYLSAVPTISTVLYIAIIVHSLLRITYARGPGDMLFVGVLAVAMGLLPSGLTFHAVAVGSYMVGWSLIIIKNDGTAAWVPYALSLALTYAVSVLVRYFEIVRTRRVHELQMVDATRQAELLVSEARLAHEAQHDALTGMPNRRMFGAELMAAFDAAHADPTASFALLHLDIDRFKLVNDSLGHDFGDRLLQSLALRLFRFVGGRDLVARLGSDEFVVLVSGVSDATEAAAKAEELHVGLEKPHVVDEHEVHLGASIGIAMFSPEYTDAEAMLRDAGIAMAEAKRSSARHRVFAADMHARALDRLKTEVDLRVAVQKGELAIHYQPIVRLKSRDVVGYEALLRWRHPQRGMLRPQAFLRLAEETGLIQHIGRWVLETACRDLAAWDPEGALCVSVNVSPRQFAHVDFEAMVKGALDDAHLAPGRLWLEVIESTVIDQPELAEARIERLHQMGVCVCVDDFGVGYSSLSYLQRYPFRVLKLDRSFVDPARHSDHILEAVIGLGRALSMRVVAEGVEDAQQLRTLLRLGCELGQGHLLSRPLPAEEAKSLRRVAVG